MVLILFSFFFTSSNTILPFNYMGKIKLGMSYKQIMEIVTKERNVRVTHPLISGFDYVKKFDAIEIRSLPILKRGFFKFRPPRLKKNASLKEYNNPDKWHLFLIYLEFNPRFYSYLTILSDLIKRYPGISPLLNPSGQGTLSKAGFRVDVYPEYVHIYVASIGTHFVVARPATFIIFKWLPSFPPPAKIPFKKLFDKLTRY